MSRKYVVGYVLAPRRESQSEYPCDNCRSERYPKCCMEQITELKRSGCRKVFCEVAMTPRETNEYYVTYGGTIYDVDNDKYIPDYGIPFDLRMDKDKSLIHQKVLLRNIYALYEGTVLKVWRLDYFCTSVSDMIKVLQILKEKKIGLKSIKDSIDTTKLNDETILNIFKALDGFRRRRKGSAISSGMFRAQKKGKKLGRPRKDPEIIQNVKKRISPENSVWKACYEIGLNRKTYYNTINREKAEQTRQLKIQEQMDKK